MYFSSLPPIIDGKLYRHVRTALRLRKHAEMICNALNAWKLSPKAQKIFSYLTDYGRMLNFNKGEVCHILYIAPAPLWSIDHRLAGTYSVPCPLPIFPGIELNPPEEGV